MNTPPPSDRNIIRTALVVIAICGGGPLLASNFVDNNTPLPAAKIDRFPPTNPTQQWSALDANTVFGALNDLRTVAQRVPINAQAFGATGAGVVDDCPAINAALAVAGSTVNGVFGGFVALPKGTYLCNTQIVIPNGTGLRGDGPADTLIKAKSTFSGTSLVKNLSQDGTQQYAFLDGLSISGSGGVESEAVVSWGSLLVNSYIRDVVISGGSNVGLRIFADGTPGGTGPVLVENTWVLNNLGHNVLVEDATTNSGAIAGVTFVNLTSSNQGSSSSAVHLKGRGRLGQTNFTNTHIEMTNGHTNMTGVTIDGASHLLFDGIQLQAGGGSTFVAGVNVLNNAFTVDVQLRAVTNINSINPVVLDAKNSVTIGAVSVPWYVTPDATIQGGARFLPSSGGVSAVFQSSAGVDRAWFDTNGRITGSSLNGAGVDALGDATNNRPLTFQPNVSSGFTTVYGYYFPVGGAGVLRERQITGGIDVRQVNTDGSQSFFQALTLQAGATFQANATLQAKVVASGGVAPTVTSCGTAPSVDATSTNFAGFFTTGTAGVTCTITFSATGGTFANPPTCLVDAPGAAVPTYTESTTAITFTVVVATTKYRYICVGH